ncbi:MAG TPA: DUF4389 domain-containing protein [Chloroflexota bacterium]|nr:DUF4389 domain-containing protein [Chloroflexota bacterium]
MNQGYGQAVSQPYMQQGDYPVQVLFPLLDRYNRFYAIPLVGYAVKWIMLIPYLIAMAAIGLVVYVLQLVAWIPVLTTGQYPEWSRNFAEGFIRYTKRASAFTYGLTDRYPSFSLQEEPGGTGDAIISFPRQESYNRLYAVPVVGLVIKEVMLIPHIVILYVLGIVVGVQQLFTWIPVLFTGQYPAWGHNMAGGYIRWLARVMAFGLGLTDVYPPFSLS